MIKRIPWHRVPSVPTLEALPNMKWSGANPAAETAALMLYIALNFMAEIQLNDNNEPSIAIAYATYVDLHHATGLSRKLIHDGLRRLEHLRLITSSGSRQKRQYQIVWVTDHPTYFKLPCQAIVQIAEITPFRSFGLRTKHELHALKLYLYFAAIRRNDLRFSMASYETIYKRLDIPERDIRKAISMMIATGLMVSIDRQHNGMTLNQNEPNKYYLNGYPYLVRRSET